MQTWSMTLDKIITYAAENHGATSVVSRLADGRMEQSSYREIYLKALRFSAALAAHGINAGDRIGTLLWNNENHMVAWYGVMGLGAVAHTLNPRLHGDQIAWIARHANDRIIVIEEQFLELLGDRFGEMPDLELIVVATDCTPPSTIAGKPATNLASFLAGSEAAVQWRIDDEYSPAGLCYTSGTTGAPKGVLYTHRSNFLHAFIANQPNGLSLGAADVVLPIVPMFHANAWGLPFIAPMVGARLVLPGPRLDGEALCELIAECKVTFAAGVPTVWQSVLTHSQKNGIKFDALRKILVGGSAPPASLIEAFEARGVEVVHGWGMTEMSPLGTTTTPIGDETSLSARELLARKTTQGRTVFPIQAVVVDDLGVARPKDGKTPGTLKVKGPTIVDRYFKAEGSALDENGYFDTGDVATIDAYGFVRLVDRAKDVIKSGGEWISSIELENYAMGQADVIRAAVIAIPDEKWGERPLLVIEAREQSRPAPSQIIAHLAPLVPKWWLPEKFAYCVIPLGATGKVDKVALRKMLAGPEASGLVTWPYASMNSG